LGEDEGKRGGKEEGHSPFVRFMPMSLDAALSRVSADRAAALTLDLVAVPSPTGDTVEVSDRFAAELRSLGMAVELFGSTRRRRS
jgi:hypothetical protein